MFVIFLSSEKLYEFNNAYGYWGGRSYNAEEGEYPVCYEDKQNKNVKKYKTKSRAEKSAKKLYDRYGYVQHAEVHEL